MPKKQTWKLLPAFVLGLLSFFVLMFIGETVGALAGFASMIVYFFVCQFVLSRGNIHAHLEDWPVMLALDAIPLVVIIIMVLVEKLPVILSQGPGILLSACGGTYAGAVVASRTAKQAEGKVGEAGSTTKR